MYQRCARYTGPRMEGPRPNQYGVFKIFNDGSFALTPCTSLLYILVW